ncbi:hypothetical protein RJ639_010581 [Escallonia herrerae]|uniref:Uncharacterized protein n=1 Tax=Escallonia herrerae TaxID=1293975 RepID=A0AA88VQW1_9ASTE|nr:hypothetical protein RJ639_010581 [Escallonia herrerae]
MLELEREKKAYNERSRNGVRRKRPTMKEVATELEDVKKWHGAPDTRHHKEEEGEEVECAIEIEQMGTWDTASTSTKSFPNNSLSSSSDIQPLLLTKPIAAANGKTVAAAIPERTPPAC